MKIYTAVFMEAVTKLWNIVNIKNLNKDKYLNDSSWKQFTIPGDPRLEYIWKVANSFEEIDTS